MIKYKTDRRIARDKLAGLYQSVRWLHFMLPKKLQESYLKSDYVVTAWEGKGLVGAGRVLTDGCFNAYFPDIVVHPGYRGRGVGREIVTRLLKRCGDCYNVTAVAEDDRAKKFYTSCGLADHRSACRKMTPITRREPSK